MKRYDLYKRSIHDRSSMAVRKEGLWVKYEDVKEFLPDAQKTAHNSDYTKCTVEVLDYIRYSIDSKAGRDIQDIIKKHFA